MAAVSIPPSPQLLSTMNSRRVPLASVPNAANSPSYRAAPAAGTKRSRNYASEQRELAYGQPPPSKRQAIEADDQDRRVALIRKPGYQANATSLTRKLEAVREIRPTQRPIERAQRAAPENLETIRQWQKHYRKVFPQIVFYFESIPDDSRTKVSRQTASLGAREEKFFSKAVTHVVTTRPIPPDHDASSLASGRSQQENAAPPKTVNPALLERPFDGHNQQKSRFTFDVASSKAALQMESRKSGDILFKAREMGMKIWSLEKLQRMLITMLEMDMSDHVSNRSHNARGSTSIANRGRDADLQQMLRNEQLNGPADRDLAATSKEVGHFRGYYIYIHDMDEKTRPVMMRDYAKVATKEEGKWPQFRMTPQGRCPFLEDPGHVKKLQYEEQQRKAQAQRAKAAAPRTRAVAAMEAQQHKHPNDKRALGEYSNIARRPSLSVAQPAEAAPSKPLDPPNVIPAKRTASIDGMPPLYGSAQTGMRNMPRFVGAEPIASGVQPSNITSAIRSQMISSTAAGPGARATTSKEYQQLQRKVLEKHVPSLNSVPSSHLNDIRAAINGDHGQRSKPTKRKAMEPLAGIHEDAAMSDEEADQRRKSVLPQKKKSVERELKPGYCENCRDKFNDFDEHVASRKHRKFAVDAENWKELDALLQELDRPLRDEA